MREGDPKGKRNSHLRGIKGSSMFCMLVCQKKSDLVDHILEVSSQYLKTVL